MAFFYQTQSLKKVGAKSPASWDEWADVAAEIRKENKQNYRW